MHVRELEWFREQIAEPRMRALLAKTELPEGLRCIDQLEFSFFDGRSCGVDSEVKASGFISRNGQVEKYHYEACDFSLSDFLSKHKDCIFLSDGTLKIYDELDRLEVNTCISSLDLCGRIFSELPSRKDLNIALTSLEYEKMRRLSQSKECSSLDCRIDSAASRAGVASDQRVDSRHSAFEPPEHL